MMNSVPFFVVVALFVVGCSTECEVDSNCAIDSISGAEDVSSADEYDVSLDFSKEAGWYIFYISPYLNSNNIPPGKLSQTLTSTLALSAIGERLSYNEICEGTLTGLSVEVEDRGAGWLPVGYQMKLTSAGSVVFEGPMEQVSSTQWLVDIQDKPLDLTVEDLGAVIVSFSVMAPDQPFDSPVLVIYRIRLEGVGYLP